MALRLGIVVVLLVVPLLSSAEDIKVTNGGPWGVFGPRVLCPPGSYAHGFSIQAVREMWRNPPSLEDNIGLHASDQHGECCNVNDIESLKRKVHGLQKTISRLRKRTGADTDTVEPKRFSGDDTAMNGLRLLCKKDDSPTDEPIESAGPYGAWSPPKECPSGRLDSFQLRVEPRRGGLDDTAANNIRFHCSEGAELEGDGLSWGAWGLWSDKCANGVCGLQAKIEGKRGPADDTGLNDVILICCTTEWRWWHMWSSW